MKHLATIRKLIDKQGAAYAFAQQIGISPTLLSDVLSGKRSISLALAMKLECRCGINGLRLLQQQVEHQWLEFKKQPRKDGL